MSNPGPHHATRKVFLTLACLCLAAPLDAGAGGEEICAGPWVQAEGHDYCPIGRRHVDTETGRESVEPVKDAFFVRCRQGWLTGKTLRVQSGWLQRSASMRAVVCESRGKVRGVDYPPDIENALTR